MGERELGRPVGLGVGEKPIAGGWADNGAREVERTRVWTGQELREEIEFGSEPRRDGGRGGRKGRVCPTKRGGWPREGPSGLVGEEAAPPAGGRGGMGSEGVGGGGGEAGETSSAVRQSWGNQGVGGADTGAGGGEVGMARASWRDTWAAADPCLCREAALGRGGGGWARPKARLGVLFAGPVRMLECANWETILHLCAPLCVLSWCFLRHPRPLSSSSSSPFSSSFLP